MAGIGFELKKLFKSNSIVSKLRGSSYAALITIGPLVLIIVTLFLIYYFLGYNNILFASRDLLASTILYVFIFSLCTTSPFNSVISRFIADKIYENDERHILPSYYMSLALNVAVSSVFALPFCLWMVFVGKINIMYTFVSYSAYIGLVLVFFSMTYITALKEYIKIAWAFLIGMGVTLLLGVILARVFGVDISFAIITAFAVGFLITGFIMFGLIRVFFKESSNEYLLIIDYFKQYWKLILTNTFYTLGLYVHNFIFWGSDLRIVVEKSFVSAPIYDMATCIAMFLNISTMVIFIVEVETNFHDKYQAYCQAVIGGTGDDISFAKNEMFASIRHEFLFVFQLQSVFTLALYLLSLILLPSLGIGGIILSITSSLAVAYLLIFIMYNMVIFIYYFNIYDRALITTIIFFVVTVIGTLISKNFTPNLYGIGVLFGAFAGFSYAYFSLRHIEKNLSYYIFCTGTIANEVVDTKWGHTTYENQYKV